MAAEPAVKNPIITPDDIDPNLSATEQVATLIGTPRFEALFVPDDFVKKLVATVDSLARSDVAARMNPTKAPTGKFVTTGEGDAVVLGAANFARYAPWIELVDSLDADATADSISVSTRSSRRLTRIWAIPTSISTIAWSR